MSPSPEGLSVPMTLTSWNFSVPLLRLRLFPLRDPGPPRPSRKSRLQLNVVPKLPAHAKARRTSSSGSKTGFTTSSTSKGKKGQSTSTRGKKGHSTSSKGQHNGKTTKKARATGKSGDNKQH